MRLSRVLSLFVCGALIAGCAPTITTSAHIDRQVDFTKYRTFEWGPADALPTGDPRLDRDPFFKDYFQGAVQRELTKRGYGLVTSGPPDLLVHYHANVTQRLDVNRVDESYGYCRAGDCPASVTYYDAGTLVVDIMDARTNKLVWRGWAQSNVENILGNPDKLAENIDRAVPRMMERLPRSH
jgi:hypothetical protein